MVNQKLIAFEEAMKGMMHYTHCFKPDMKAHKKYEQLYGRIYKRIYPRMQLLYKEMNRLKKIL